MILPNKYISLSESFIGLSALIIETLGSNKLTVDKLWSEFNKRYINSKVMNIVPTYQKYVTLLVFMYTVGMIEYTAKGEIFNENIKINNQKSKWSNNPKC